MCTSLDCKRKLEKTCREEGEHTNSTQEGPSWLLELNQDLLTSYLVHSTNCRAVLVMNSQTIILRCMVRTNSTLARRRLLYQLLNSKWLHKLSDSDVLQMSCLEMALLHHVWGGLTLWPCSHSAWWVMSPRGHSSCWC